MKVKFIILTITICIISAVAGGYLAYRFWDVKQLHLFRLMVDGKFSAWYCFPGNESFGYKSVQFENFDVHCEILSEPKGEQDE